MLAALWQLLQEPRVSPSWHTLAALAVLRPAQAGCAAAALRQVHSAVLAEKPEVEQLRAREARRAVVEHPAVAGIGVESLQLPAGARERPAGLLADALHERGAGRRQRGCGTPARGWR